MAQGDNARLQVRGRHGKMQRTKYIASLTKMATGQEDLQPQIVPYVVRVKELLDISPRSVREKMLHRSWSLTEPWDSLSAEAGKPFETYKNEVNVM